MEELAAVMLQTLLLVMELQASSSKQHRRWWGVVEVEEVEELKEDGEGRASAFRLLVNNFFIL